jgi:hypothetical protein
VFSDGSGVYVFGISNGMATANPVAPSGGGIGSITSVTIAESQNAIGESSGGVMTACVGQSPDVSASFSIPTTPEANVFGSYASLGEPSNQYGQPSAYGGAAQFSRNIYGASALLAAAGVTPNSEYVVTLFKVTTASSGGSGSITLTQEGQRATVQLPNTLDATLGITVFDTFKIPIPSRPIPGLKPF